MSRPYAEVIGDPISHSKSPLMHTFWLEALGIAGEYRTAHVRQEKLAGYFVSRRKDPDWRGCNVTIPHKEHVALLIDQVRPQAVKVGAINTVWREGGKLIGTNTDVEGVAEAVRGIDLVERHVAIIGAGGAARSAFVHLAGLGCASVRVMARDPNKARAAAEDCGLDAQHFRFGPEGGFLNDAALVINATQLGMLGQDEMPPFILDGLSRMTPDGIVFDMVYAPRETELLREAGRLGRHSVGGLTMLVGQAKPAFARFFGTVPPPGSDAELMNQLTQ